MTWKKHQLMVTCLSILLGAQPALANFKGVCAGTVEISPAQLVKQVVDDAQRFPNFILVCAHRGFWSYGGLPQNSKAAVQAAIDLDLDCVENDIRYSKDGHPVIFHDPNMDMMVVDAKGNPVTGQIEDHTLAQIQSYRLRDRLMNITDEHIVTLDEYILLTKGRIVVNHEFKSPGGSKNKQYFKDLIIKLKDNGVLQEAILKGQLTSADYREVIESVPGVEFKDVTYWPKFFFETPVETLRSEITAFRSMNVKGYELVIENDDPKYYNLRSMFTELEKNFERYGQFDMFPESGRGKYRRTNVWRKTNPADDYRGDWDWIFDDNYSFIVSDRPCLMTEYLALLGKRKI